MEQGTRRNTTLWVSDLYRTSVSISVRHVTVFLYPGWVFFLPLTDSVPFFVSSSTDPPPLQVDPQTIQKTGSQSASCFLFVE